MPETQYIVWFGITFCFGGQYIELFLQFFIFEWFLFQKNTKFGEFVPAFEYLLFL